MIKRFSAIIFIFFSCRQEKDRTCLIVKDSIKYWDVVKKTKLFDIERSKIFPFYCYSFNKNKEVILYKYQDGKRIKYDYGDLIIENKWNLINDSTMLFGLSNYRISKLTADSLNIFNDEDTVILIKSIHQ